MQDTAPHAHDAQADRNGGQPASIWTHAPAKHVFPKFLRPLVDGGGRPGGEARVSNDNRRAGADVSESPSVAAADEEERSVAAAAAAPTTSADLSPTLAGARDHGSPPTSAEEDDAEADDAEEDGAGAGRRAPPPTSAEEDDAEEDDAEEDGAEEDGALVTTFNPDPFGDIDNG